MAVGRPKEFNQDETLNKVVELFWRHGYEGTSVTAITRAVGINKPSLYATFGSKEELFRRAFERYWERLKATSTKLLNDKSARNGLEQMLKALVDYQTQPGMPHGCLAVHGSLVGSDDSSPVRDQLLAKRKQTEQLIHKRLIKAKVEGELSRDANPEILAAFYATVIQGLAVQAAGQSTTEKLHLVIAVAMNAWPSD